MYLTFVGEPSSFWYHETRLCDTLPAPFEPMVSCYPGHLYDILVFVTRRIPMNAKSKSDTKIDYRD